MPTNRTVANQSYDYIVTGGGCAGISLLTRMVKSGAFQNKRVLLIERETKIKNDRTWCFWESRAGFFEHLVHHHWPQLNFYSSTFSSLLNIAPYRYKMIRGIDFYQDGYELIRQSGNIEIMNASIDSIHNTSNGVRVRLSDRTVESTYVFNSVQWRKPNLGSYHVLQQHFKGWIIECPEDRFDPGVATLMDFRVSQQHGTTFVYVLPLSARHALVEYTLFTQDILQMEEYNAALRQYISQFLAIPSYIIIEEEFGIIPMTDYPFPAQEGNIIHMGTAGGQTKASSGYTFQFIQKDTERIVDSLIRTGSPAALRTPASRKFSFYDATLLNILAKRTLEGSEIFADLFRNGSAQTVFKFLDNETEWWEDLSIMKRLPITPFARAALQELTSHKSSA